MSKAQGSKTTNSPPDQTSPSEFEIVPRGHREFEMRVQGRSRNHPIAKRAYFVYVSEH